MNILKEKMMKIIIVLASILMPFFIMAQETEEVDSTPQKQKELGLVFSNFDRFGVTFKIGNEKALWRFASLIGSNDKITDKSGAVKSSGENSNLVLT